MYPDDPRAADLEIIDETGEIVGSVTLRPDHMGDMAPWGSLSHWASSDLIDWMGDDDYDDRLEAVLSACAEALED